MTRNPPLKIELDCIGETCPAPIIRVAREAARLGADGGFLIVRADDPAFRADVEAWARSAAAEVLELADEANGTIRALVRIGDAEYFGAPSMSPEVELDLRGVQCPGPVIALAKAAALHPVGTVVHIVADDPAFAMDLRSWLGSGKAELLELDDSATQIHARVRIGAPASVPVPSAVPLSPSSAIPLTPPSTPFSPAPSTQAAPPATATSPAAGVLAPRPATDGCTLLVLHNDHEALLAALLVANGAAAQGMKTTLFFTFWGLNLLRGDHPDPTRPKEKIGFMQRMMKWMMPKGPTRQKLGQMHFAGLGKGMLSSIMRSQNILGLPELMRSAQDLGVEFTACTMSMSVMGITKRDLYPYPNLEYAGVATFVERARNSSLSLVF